LPKGGTVTPGDGGAFIPILGTSLLEEMEISAGCLPAEQGRLDISYVGISALITGRGELPG
jgi:hypothetical protein